MMNIGVIGYGYWGPNLVRNFAETKGAAVSAVSDLKQANLDKAQVRHPGVLTFRTHQELITHPKVDAVAIATPVSTHFELAMAALRAGKHVFVEKPITETSAQAEQMIAEAARRKLVLMVDHTFIYTGAVRKMRELIQAGELGKIFYYDSVRVNLGLFQHDVNVIWDLAVHDLSIMDYVLGVQPIAVQATGVRHIEGQPEDVAYLTMLFKDSLIAHIHVNWLAPVKIRHTLVGGSKKMIVYNDLEPSEKIKVYDKGLVLEDRPEEVYQMLVGYRVGDIWSPQLDPQEALRLEAATFVRCVERGEAPSNDGTAGLRVVKILEAAMTSMQQRGQLVDIC
jgi:predicted dehydrogenase